jgi:integrase
MQNNKSESKPIAQITNLCDVREPVKYDVISVAITVMQDRRIHEQIRLLIDLMYTNALRISEALQLTSSDIISANTIVVNSKKHGNKRIGYCTYNSDVLQKYRGMSNVKLFNFDRYFAYRMFRRFGIVISSSDEVNSLVTHSLRVAIAKELQSAESDIQLTASQLGHKNTKNTQIYVNNKRK